MKYIFLFAPLALTGAFLANRTPLLIAQTRDVPVASSALDSGFHFPHIRISPGQKNPSAVSFLMDYLSTVNAGTVHGLCGSGTIVYGASSGEQMTAKLAIDENSRSRLDVTAASGTRSVRTNGLEGGAIRENGSTLYFTASTARAGLLPTPDLIRDLIADPQSALSDDGEVTIGDVRYKAISYSRQLIPNQPQSSLIPPVIVQLLFDPTSHLLLRAVSSARLSYSSRTAHLRIVSLSEYQRHDNVLIPTEIAETLDGQPTWQLKLTQLEASCSNPVTFFSLGGHK